MIEVRYPATLEQDETGAWNVTFPDIPGALSFGDTVEEALYNGAEALTGVLESMIDDGDAIPEPSAAGDGYMVAPALNVQAAILIRSARGDRPVADLARALDTPWPAASRLEKSGNWPSLRTLSRAAAALGKRVTLRFE